MNWMQRSLNLCVWIPDVGADRFTFGFTIKDSPDFFINVAAWGSDGYINGLSNSFSIGDCGEEVTVKAPISFEDT